MRLSDKLKELEIGVREKRKASLTGRKKNLSIEISELSSDIKDIINNNNQQITEFKLECSKYKIFYD
jgi:hypothetical protein